MKIAFELNGKAQVSILQCVMICDEHIVFNVGRTFLSDHFAGRNARITHPTLKFLNVDLIHWYEIGVEKSSARVE